MEKVVLGPVVEVISGVGGEDRIAHLLSGLSRRFQDQPGDLVGMRDQ
jgi:hypothetical protein